MRNQEILNFLGRRNTGRHFGGIDRRGGRNRNIANVDHPTPNALLDVDGANVFDKKLTRFPRPKSFLDGNAVGVNFHDKRVASIEGNEKRNDQPGECQVPTEIPPGRSYLQDDRLGVDGLDQVGDGRRLRAIPFGERIAAAGTNFGFS